ncbi:MAG TPA: BrnT family toxin [Longimicrobium sp.]|nr:BrnT family toxin [Longimicrobium sp.]
MTAFEWDTDKAAANFAKHGVSFLEAETLFSDPLAILHDDPEHSSSEDRFVALGQSYLGRILFVVYAERRGVIRIISARKATAGERRAYEEGGSR